MNADVFWAYVPDPPLLQPVGWEMSFVPVYVNDTILLGGFSDKHISPQSANIFLFRVLFTITNVLF